MVNDRSSLDRTLRFPSKFLVHIFIHLRCRSIADADHCIGFRSRQFHGSTAQALSAPHGASVRPRNKSGDHTPSHSQHFSSPDLFRFGVSL